jgi:hypothetical protein
MPSAVEDRRVDLSIGRPDRPGATACASELVENMTRLLFRFVGHARSRKHHDEEV